MIVKRPLRRTSVWAAFAWLLLIALVAAQDSPPVAAQESPPVAAQESPPVAAQESPPSVAAGALDDSDWYDSAGDSVVPIDVDPVVDDSMNRDSRWLPKAKRVSAPTAGGGAGAGGGAATGGTGLFGSGLTLGNLIGWMLLIAILVAGVCLLLYALSKTEIDLGNDNRLRESAMRRRTNKRSSE